MTTTEQKVIFAQEMQNINISDDIYDYLESKYLQGANIILIKNVIDTLVVLDTQNLDDFNDVFNQELLTFEMF
ncbi:hypothetical protein [Photobacterium damselae]|uniref:hypothetical protein n=1 Tax=Photobacterium damselae TaxID=38293 RepID=UPI00406988F3